MTQNTSLIEVTGNDAVLDGVTIEGMTTNAQSNDSKNPIFAIKIAGENATIKNSKLNGPTEGKAYSMVFVDGTVSGPVVIEGNTFDNLDGVHNALEFNNGYKIEDGTVIRNNKFVGDVSHTALTMMNFEEGAYVTLENNEIGGIRISNTGNTDATIEFKGGKAVFNKDYSEDWGLVLIQQLNNEDYSKMTIKVDNFKKEDGKLYTENAGKGKDLFLATYSNTGDEHKLDDAKAPVIIFEQGHDKVTTARNGNEISYGKRVSELQQNIKVSQDGKITGTLPYVTEYTGNPTHQEGNFLAIHLDKTKIHPNANETNVKLGWDDANSAPDPNDWNYTLRLDVDSRHTKPLKVWFNDEIIYEYDLTGLVLNKQA